MRKYIITGAQGCGKGTQAALLASAHDLVHISIGDIFRRHLDRHTKLGARIRRIVTEGQLVPDELVTELVRQRLDEHDWNHGFILDGFPRNVPQARFFLEHYDLDAVVLIDLPDAVAVERILARRICSGCCRDYNVLFKPPAAAETCDACGRKLMRRADDNEDAIRARLRDFHELTAPALERFRERTAVVTVDGTGAPLEIHQEICATLGLRAPLDVATTC
ncbi:MAG TPA: nucleoside monophosphate kinase [bacterium]